MRAVDGVPWLGLLAVCIRLKFNCLLSGDPDRRYNVYIYKTRYVHYYYEDTCVYEYMANISCYTRQIAHITIHHTSIRQSKMFYEHTKVSEH